MRLLEIPIECHPKDQAELPEEQRTMVKTLAVIDLDRVTSFWKDAEGGLKIYLAGGEMYYTEIPYADFMRMWGVYGRRRMTTILSLRPPEAHLSCPDCGSQNIKDSKCGVCGRVLQGIPPAEGIKL